MRSRRADRVETLNDLRARMRSRRAALDGARPSGGWLGWGATATADGLRIWAGSHVERELLELKWARLELQYPLGLEYDASY
jgi:hypothetical protein